MRLLITFLAFWIVPCAASIVEQEPRRVVIAGRVDNYDPQNPVKFIVNRLGVSSEAIPLTVDSVGNFHGSFATRVPVDGWMTVRTNFCVLLSPGDSLYVCFDGRWGSRPRLLPTVQFSGRGAGVNRNAARFQQLYFADPVYADREREERAVKEYNAQEYLQYADTVRQRLAAIYDGWVKEVRPDAKSRRWARAMNVEHYYNMIGMYPLMHRESNGLGWADSTTMEYGYFARLDERLPVAVEDIAAPYALSSFANRYSMRVREQMWENRSEQEKAAEASSWLVTPWGSMISASDISDSLDINGILKYAPDDLLKQIMLTSHFDREFKRQSVEAFEKFRNVVDTHVTMPFLREPLLEHYAEVKARLEAPGLYSDAVLKEVAASDGVKEIFDEILRSNKGKVIYIDFWATWCAPCLGEFPRSKVIEKEFHGLDVAFVYICLESQRELALATLDKHQLGGSHYILSHGQSLAMRDLFKIHGIPFYVLIDKEGTIVGSGSHLRPLSARGEIVRLLE